jgi:hypothetical protein
VLGVGNAMDQCVRYRVPDPHFTGYRTARPTPSLSRPVLTFPRCHPQPSRCPLPPPQFLVCTKVHRPIAFSKARMQGAIQECRVFSGA